MTGWPWPFGGVQDWFEGLVNTISMALSPVIQGVIDTLKPVVEGVSSAVWNALPTWIRDGLLFIGELAGQVWQTLWDFVRDPIGSMQAGFDWIVSTVGATLSVMSTALDGVAAGVWSALPDWIRTGILFLGEMAGQAWTSLWNFVRDPIGSIQAGLNWVVDSAKTMFDGAVGGITSLVGDVLAGVAAALGGALQAFWGFITAEIPKALSVVAGFINDAVVTPILSGLGWIFTRLSDLVKGFINQIHAMFAHHSPITPEQALPLGIMAVMGAVGAGAVAAGLIDIASTKVLATGLDLRAIGNYVTAVINPSMFMGALLGVIVGVGIKTPLTQFYRRMFRPEIPDIKTATSMLWRGTLTEDQYRDVVARWGFGDPFEAAYLDLTKEIPPTPDLVTMVVREAFVPEMVIAAPTVFAEYLIKSGYSKEWADRYWTAHFVPIALRQAYENLWRGFWDKDDFMRALHIADIHPMWREDIYKVAFRAPGVREMGYGYDTGLYSVEDIIEYRRWGGLSPEDAEKAGLSMVAYRTEAEREALRREAIADYIAGLDDEAELKDKLTQIGGRPEIIELWVARANYRLERDLTLDLVKVVITDFVKRWSTEDELRLDLIELGVVPERREVMIREAKARRLKYKREEAAEKHKLLTAAKIAKARELGLVGDAEFVERHIKAGYLEDDAELLLAIELTPRPVTPEEIERRRKTITSRLARAQRRWEARLARIQGHVELTALQLEDTTTMKDEALDVIDAQIAVYDELIEAATEERIPVLEERRKVLVQRRELTEVRWAARIRRLTEQHTKLLEEKALMEKHRHEELGEYTAELKLIGEVAG